MRFAPPPWRVAGTGRLAVPIDIQTIAAKLTFDAAAQSVEGDATVDFQHGVDNGDPIFDLRQPVREVWLDGAALRPGAVALRRFGAKREQALRVLAKKLKAGDRHRLRLKYALSAPPLLASTKGGYLPELRWSGGGAVDFNFGFTDLGGGRYLEAWVPANLIYDRFALRLDVRIRKSSTPHVVITNGDATEVSRNHWRIRFPDTFTALSPMLQLHPRDSVEFATAPAGRRRLEAWKFRSSPVNLIEQLANIKRWLDRNERRVGVYPHGDNGKQFFYDACGISQWRISKNGDPFAANAIFTCADIGAPIPVVIRARDTASPFNQTTCATTVTGRMTLTASSKPL